MKPLFATRRLVAAALVWTPVAAMAAPAPASTPLVLSLGSGELVSLRACVHRPVRYSSPIRK